MDIHFKNIPATYHHIPRTGGTSFTSWVEHNVTDFEIAPLKEASLENIHKIPNYDWVKTVWPELGTRFTFVRNPYSRLVSLYHYVGELVGSRLAIYKDSLTNCIPLTNFRTQPYQPNTIVKCIIDDVKMISLYNKGFDYWLKTMLEAPEEFYDSTNLSSHNLIYSFWGGETQVSWFCGNLPDIVIKIENLDQDFVKIQELLGNLNTLPHLNTSQHGNYQDYYNQETKALVNRMYKDDLEAFEYEF